VNVLIINLLNFLARDEMQIAAMLYSYLNKEEIEHCDKVIFSYVDTLRKRLKTRR